MCFGAHRGHKLSERIFESLKGSMRFADRAPVFDRLGQFVLLKRLMIAFYQIIIQPLFGSSDTFRRIWNDHSLNCSWQLQCRSYQNGLVLFAKNCNPKREQGTRPDFFGTFR